MRTAAGLRAALAHAFVPAAAAVAQGRLPCAALGIVTAEGATAELRAGWARLDPPEVLRPAHLFDLASLTKPILTTTLVLEAVADGLVDLADPLSAHMPDLFQYDRSHWTRTITLEACLTHRSGLPAVAPIYTWGTDSATLRALVLQRDWPRAGPVYSDINFILIGLLVERLRGRALRDLVRGPGLAAGPVRAAAVATEACTWRGRTIQGEVHDENAHALGGIAGHAGLFGTLAGVLEFARGLLADTSPIRALAFAPRTPTRTLGWQVAHQGWSGGNLCAPATIGHTGFTGTGLWLDPARGVAWALLTNRVHPSRHADTGIGGLRTAVGDRLMAALSRSP